uniref:Uncharacterized protein n=1 Tax=Arion vulgaris TaxID=1028688 RepID=A0A0B7B9M0_9EUPU
MPKISTIGNQTEDISLAAARESSFHFHHSFEVEEIHSKVASREEDHLSHEAVHPY